MVDEIKNLLEKAYLLHTSGKLEEAKIIYEKFIALYPNNPDAINFYAQLLMQIGDLDNSILMFEKVLNLTKLEIINYDIAKIYFIKKDYNNALETLLKIKQPDKDTLELLATIYEILNKIEEMINTYIKLYDMDNKDISVILKLASIFDSLKMKEDLIFFLEKAFELNEGNEALCEKLIIECSYIRKNKLAMKYCNKCLEINPNNLIALLNLCKLNIRLDKVEEAREYCEKADKLYPNKLQVLVEKFSIYRKLRKWEECINIAKKIITHYPANATGYGCLAEAYYESVDYNLALEYYNKALEFEPKEIIYIQNKASCYEKMGKPEEAITILKEAINVNPENVASYKSIAFTYLKQKKYEEARDTYFFTINPATMDMERLNRVNIDSKFIKYAESMLNKENISNKKLLIFNNAGFGDFIMMSRYIPCMSKKAKEITVEVTKPLYRLFKNNLSKNNTNFILEKDEMSTDYDYTASSMALLYNSELDFYNIPFAEGWLKVEQKVIEQFSKLDIFKTKKKKIGLFWQGNKHTMPNRFLDIKDLNNIVNIENCQFYSLDITEKDEETKNFINKNNIIDCAKYITDFYDTAAIIKNLDLIITIDSSIVHLAGALSKETYLMLPKDAEWRWFKDEKATPWYNSVTIFKQKRQSDWSSVITEIKEYIKK